MTDTALVTMQHGAIEEVKALEQRIVDFLPGAANVPHEIRMALAQIAIAHHLDPFLKEVVPIPRKDREGRIVGWDMFIGIAGWRSSAHRSEEYWGRRFEKATDEDRRMAGAGPNDLMIRCVVMRRKTGQQPAEYDGFGIVGADERSKMNRLQLVRLRAERDAMKAAFPISAPPGVRVVDDVEPAEIEHGPGWEVVIPEAGKVPGTATIEPEPPQPEPSEPLAASQPNGKRKQASLRCDFQAFDRRAREFVSRYPRYANDDGTPNKFHLLGAAAAEGFDLVTDENMADVFVQIAQRHAIEAGAEADHVPL